MIRSAPRTGQARRTPLVTPRVGGSRRIGAAGFVRAGTSDPVGGSGAGSSWAALRARPRTGFAVPDGTSGLGTLAVAAGDALPAAPAPARARDAAVAAGLAGRRGFACSGGVSVADPA